MVGIGEQDSLSGQTKTGHEWDGITELNTPMPKWWVYTFFVCIAFAIGYWVLYPAIPWGGTYTPGILGFHARKALDQDLVIEAGEHKAERDKIAAMSVADIAKDHDLAAYATGGGEALFRNNCVPCHQAGGSGAPGYPVLADNVWLWGGTYDAIETTITHGIRSEKDADTRTSQMPAFGHDKILTPEQIAQVADYVVAMSDPSPEARAKLPTSGAGHDIFVQNCAACHSSDGQNAISDGNQMMGAPPLGSGISLYAGPGKHLTVELVSAQVNNPRHGVMPAWADRLSKTDIKELTLYVHGLGGGQ